jgi:hypothetical protein
MAVIKIDVKIHVCYGEGSVVLVLAAPSKRDIHVARDGILASTHSRPTPAPLTYRFGLKFSQKKIR